MAIDVTKGISHLEHLEDFILLGGINGVDKAITTVEKFVDKIKDQNDDVIVSEKIDGAPSLFFGKAPDGRFFVSTKSIFNKDQKIAYSLADIQRLWSGGIVKILSFAFKNLKPAYKTNDVCAQGDLLWVNKEGKTLTNYEDEQYITFQPNVIMYAVPVDNKSELYRNVRMANLGIVVHGTYETNFGVHQRIELDRLPDAKTKEVAQSLDKDRRVFCVDPFIDDLSALSGSDDILTEITDLIKSVKQMGDDIDKKFDDEWVEASNPMIKKARKLLPQFINQQVRLSGDSDTIITSKNEKEFLKRFKSKLKEFLNLQSKTAQEKLQTSAGRERKAQSYKEFQEWVDQMDQTFEPILQIYFRLFSIKNLIIKLFDQVEKKLGKTFVVDRKNDYEMKAVKPEGYVILNGPDMVKIVDRAEFSKNNLLYSPFNEETVSRGTTGDPESIGDKKPIHIKKNFVDSVVEDVLDSLDCVKSLCDGFNDEKIVETADKFKKYNAVYVGRFQPPTVAHIKNIIHLSKLFKNVYVLLSDSKNKNEKYLAKNPLDVDTRKDVFLSDTNIKFLKNVKFEGGSTSMAFGIHLPEKEDELRELFEIPGKEILVLTMGKEEDRFFEMRNRDALFVLNMNGEPTEEKKNGLYGIDLLKIAPGMDKISSTQIRKDIRNDDIESAKEMMAGSDTEKNHVIEKIKNYQQQEKERKEKVLASENYFKIEDFDINKEIVKDIEEDFGIGQEEAMDMLLDILESRD